ncbi:cell envelope integrity protein CreD [Acidicapsa dinghuensis]|uniref:Cell envelope integrity protein CreD n=1 Tax=Acidicapsa dinghuensis TaxID=2218256 RepID=A0ABW1EMH0_9BACT|nr:cell envelope integrity protein CreD [Acidicapsa dinghuensis]
MSEFSVTNPPIQIKFGSRSMGVKLVIVCALALVMAIPAFFVESIVSDRTRNAEEVVQEVSSHVGGKQTFLGPTLAIPYTIPPRSKTDSPTRAVYFIFPAEANAEIATATQERQRSLFRVSVFQASLNMGATFDLSHSLSSAPEGTQLDWDHAEILVGVSDPRGALADATLNAGGKTITFTPAQTASDLIFGKDTAQSLRLTLFGASINGLVRPNAQFQLSANMNFSGAQRIAVLAYGKTTHVSMQGDWPNPGFDGGFLPVSRNISTNGFTAQWTIPYIARGVRAESTDISTLGLEQTSLGISFIELADPYQSVNRSLKYLPLFLGLLFLTYFLFEVTSRKRVHPAQYLLVGIAQIIFYLLLLSFAERIGFDFAFLIAGVSTVILLSLNTAWIFDSRRQGIRALAILAPLYGLIYTLLRLEDNALLVGAIASFLAIAAVMYFTKRIDWYSSLPPNTSPQSASSYTPSGVI